MDEQRRINYGIAGCCLGIILGFAIGFPVFFQLTYEQRSYIGVPFMLVIVIGMCIVGGVIGVKLAIRTEEEDED